MVALLALKSVDAMVVRLVVEKAVMKVVVMVDEKAVW